MIIEGSLGIAAYRYAKTLGLNRCAKMAINGARCLELPGHSGQCRVMTPEATVLTLTISYEPTDKFIRLAERYQAAGQ